MAGIFLTQGKGGLAEGQHFVWDTSRLVSPIPASAQSQTASGSGCETTNRCGQNAQVFPSPANQCYPALHTQWYVSFQTPLMDLRVCMHVYMHRHLKNTYVGSYQTRSTLGLCLMRHLQFFSLAAWYSQGVAIPSLI